MNLLTPQAVATRLAVSRSAVYKLIRLGHLPCIRVGTLVRVREVDLNEWIENGGSQ